MEIRIEKLTHNDLKKFMELIRIFEEVFEMKDFDMPCETYLQQLLARDDFFVFVALVDNKVIGGLTSYLLQQYYSASPLVYIYDLAVMKEYQRKGIGKMLIDKNNNYSREMGADVVMVQADLADDHAIKFYHSTGGTGEKVIHFDYKLNIHKPTH